jgi:hypothetical protein
VAPYLVDDGWDASCGDNRDANRIPTRLCKIASHEEMSTRFQPLQDTHVTCVGIQDHILPLEKFPGVNTVFQKKPEKDFMFHLTAGFPNPSKCWMNMFAPNHTLINLGRREGTPPGKGPKIGS